MPDTNDQGLGELLGLLSRLADSGALDGSAEPLKRALLHLLTPLKGALSSAQPEDAEEFARACALLAEIGDGLPAAPREKTSAVAGLQCIILQYAREYGLACVGFYKTDEGLLARLDEPERAQRLATECIQRQAKLLPTAALGDLS